MPPKTTELNIIEGGLSCVIYGLDLHLDLVDSVVCVEMNVLPVREWRATIYVLPYYKNIAI